MFDIGFSELVVCAVVALIVIGPERMPEAVRTIGLWVGRLKRSLRETRSEIERQMGMDDIRRQLHNEDIMRSLEDARKDINSVIEQSQNSIHSAQMEAEKIYTSEPDLPYHSHMNETTAITNDAAVNVIPEQHNASESAPPLDHNSDAHHATDHTHAATDTKKLS